MKKKNIKKKKKVLISGDFNSVHPGHLRLFNFAKKIADELVVCVRSNQLANHSFVDETLRLENLTNNTLVDRAYIFYDSIKNVISEERPDYVVKGKEFEFSVNEEQSELDKYGGKLEFVSGENIFSPNTFLLPGRYDINIPKDFISSHNINIQNFKNYLKTFQNKNILVVGDIIIDEYIDCTPIGMSQEDASLVAVPNFSKKYLGGAGIVASHAAGLGANTYLLSIAGDDENYSFAKKELKKNNVSSNIFLDSTRSTILKQRFKAKNNTLFRLNKIVHHEVTSLFINKFINQVNKIINKLDAIIFADFNYGCLPQKLVDEIIKIARKKDVFIAADCQSSSQIGDISRYKNVDLITPTEYEARLSLKNYNDSVVILSQKLSSLTAVKNVLLKMGSEGVFIFNNNSNDNNWTNDLLQPLNRNPVDTSGAGDSMLVSSTLSLICNASIWEASFLGSIASAVQISRQGNIPLSINDITTFLNNFQ